jgi:hypothetical protein
LIGCCRSAISEAPAPIDPKEKPVTAGRSLEAAQAVTARGAGSSVSCPFSPFDGLTHKTRNAALPLLQCVYFGVCVMNDVVEGILNTYQSMRPLDAERAADSRKRISRYIENLASAGQRDDEQLTIYGLAYLTELLEGPDPRFTGC